MILPVFGVKGISEFIKKVEKTHNFYVQLSDEGGVRFSKPAAWAFANLLKTNIRTGKYDGIFGPNDVKFTPTDKKKKAHKSYAERSGKGSGSHWGFSTGTMARDIQAFRSQFSGAGAGSDKKRRGYVVGIKRGQSFYAHSGNKLKWFEDGTMNNQRERPVMRLTLNEFMSTEFPKMMKKISKDFSHIWSKK